MARLSHRKIRKLLVQAIERLLTRTDLPVKLRPYQRKAFECMLEWLKSGKGRRRYIAHATGLGKTLEFVSLAAEADKEGLRFLIIVPNKTLVVQTAKEIRTYTGGDLEVGHISSLPKYLCDVQDDEVLAIKGHQGQRVVIITQQSFGLKADALARDYDPHVIVRDEMHWSYSENQLAALNCFPDAVIIGWSATPDYLVSVKKKRYVPVELDNGQTLYADPKRMADTHFEECLHRVSLREGIERQFLAPLAWAELEVDVNLEGIGTAEGPLGVDYDQKALIDLMGESWETILETIRRLYEDNEYDLRNRQAAAVCMTVAMAEQFAEVIGKYTSTAVVIGETPNTERERLLDLFDQNEDLQLEEHLHAIASVNVLKEGWNSRNVEVIFMLRPTRSRVLYEQVVGRGSRKRRDGRSKTSLIFDPHYLANKFAPLSAPVLYGKPGDEVVSGDILIGPKGSYGEKIKTTSPYLSPNARPKIRVVQPVEIEYWTDETGTVEIKGERWGNERGLATSVGLSITPINSRLSQCRSRPGKDLTGKTVTLYSLDDMKKACAELLVEGLPKTGANGLIEIEDKIGEGELAEIKKEVWGTTSGIAAELKLSEHTIASRRDRSRSRPGKDLTGKTVTLYSLDDMKKACAELLVEGLPKTGANGLIEIEDKIGEGELAEIKKEVWGTVFGIAKVLRLGWRTVSGRLARCQSRPGKDVSGRVTIFYPLEDAKKACAELLVEGLPKTGANGLIEIEDEIGEGELAEVKKEVWGTVLGIAKVLGLSKQAIKNRLSRCRSRPGKNVSGREVILYSIEDMKKACVGMRNSTTNH